MCVTLRSIIRHMTFGQQMTLLTVFLSLRGANQICLLTCCSINSTRPDKLHPSETHHFVLPLTPYYSPYPPPILPFTHPPFLLRNPFPHSPYIPTILRSFILPREHCTRSLLQTDIIVLWPTFTGWLSVYYDSRST